MTINSEELVRKNYNGPISEGINVVIPFSFTEGEHEEVKVLKTAVDGTTTDLSVNVDYEIQVDEQNLQLVNPLDTGEMITVYRRTPYTQEVPFQQSGRFPSVAVEGALDKLQRQNEEQRDEIRRAIKLPVNTDGDLINIEMPVPSPGKGIKGNADGTGFINSTYDPDEQVANASGYADAAAASAAAASTSEENASISEQNAAQSAIDAATFDPSLFVKKDGTTAFTGQITVPDGTTAEKAINKGQLDTGLGTKLDITSFVQPGYVPYSVNSGLTSINKVDNNNVSFTGSAVAFTVPKGKTYSGLSIASVLANVDGNCEILLKESGISGNTVTPTIVNDTTLGNVLFVDFASGSAVDLHGNTIVTLGNPTYSNGKYVGDGTGDGLKVTTITTLGQGNWEIQGKFKFNTNNTTYIMCRAFNNYGFSLYRHTDNKLYFFSSSNGTSWDIANNVAGSKSNYDTSSEYTIRLVFDGSSYKVYVDGTLDLTVTSSTKIYSSLGGLVFGADSGGSNSLAGTMDDLKVLLPVTVSEGYGAPANYSIADGSYYTDISICPMAQYYKSNGVTSITTDEFGKAGKYTRTSGTMGTPTTYAFNRKFMQKEVSPPSAGSSVSVAHNIGLSAELIKANVYMQCITAVDGYSIGDTVNSWWEKVWSYNNERTDLAVGATSKVTVDKNNLTYAMCANGTYYTKKTTNQNATESPSGNSIDWTKWKLVFIAEGVF